MPRAKQDMTTVADHLNSALDLNQKRFMFPSFFMSPNRGFPKFK